MSDLNAAYEQLARPWTHEQLAAHYREAKRRAEQLTECDQDHQIRQPIAMLATAVPACATLSVAIHLIHVIRATGAPGVANQLLGNAEKSSVIALYRCHQALELDGRAHDYTADEWLPNICSTAAQLLEAARPHRDPPSLLAHTQAATRWLSQAIIDLDEDQPDAAAAIADASSRLLALWVFADVSRGSGDNHDQ